MQVDYLLFHEDKLAVDKMLQHLTAKSDFLFDTASRRAFGLSTVSRTFMNHEQTWDNVTVRAFGRVGRNVIEYNVTLPSTYTYPELVAAALIEKGWWVKVRYRNTQATNAWTYIQSEFPEGTAYTRPSGWVE